MHIRKGFPQVFSRWFDVLTNLSDSSPADLLQWLLNLATLVEDKLSECWSCTAVEHVYMLHVYSF